MPPYLYVSVWDPPGLTIIDACGETPPLCAPAFVGQIQAGIAAPSRLSVFANYAYIPDQAFDCLTIINVSDPTNPAFVSTIGGAGAPNYLNGAQACHIRNNGYCYVVSFLDQALSIFDVSDPTNPILAGVIRGAGAPPGGNYLSGPTSIYVDDNLVAYVAAQNDNSLTFIDVSNPLAPALLGSVAGAGAPNFLSSIRDVFVRGNYAYTVSFTDQALSIFDVSNPVTGTETLRPNGPGSETSIDTQVPVGGEHWDKVAEVVADDDASYVKNATAPAGVWQRDLYQLPNHSTGHGNINSVTVFIRVRNNASGAQASIRTHGVTYDSANLAVGPWTTVSNTWLVNPFTVLPWTWDEVDALEAGVRLSGSVAAPDWADCTQVYVVISWQEVLLVGTVAHACLAGAWSLCIYGNYAYTAAQNSQALGIFNIANPAAPFFVGQLIDGRYQSPRDVIVTQETFPRAYILGSSAFTDSCCRINVSNPAVPVYVSWLQGSGPPSYMGCPQYITQNQTFPPIVQTNPATGVT